MVKLLLTLLALLLILSMTIAQEQQETAPEEHSVLENYAQGQHMFYEGLLKRLLGFE
jgi:hypothetical protein